jgi:thiol:disulfide interchange protein DsbA
MRRHAAMAGMLAALGLTACVRDSAEVHLLGEYDEWLAGTHYVVVQPSAEMNAAADGKVTVIEFFWYGSPQCYTLDAHLVLWNRRKPDNVEFKRVPSAWGQYDRPHARLFYTLEALGRNDLHAVIFDTFHARGNRLANADEQLRFAKEQGIDERKFLDVYESSAVTERVNVAEQLLLHYQVDKLPTLVVNGKYKTDLTRVGRSGEVLMRLVTDLVASEPAVD